MATSNSELTAKINSKAPANGAGKPATVADQVRHALEKMKGEIAAALPKHVTPDRMARIALTEIRTNPKLLECTIESLLAAVMKASQLGLEPGLIGHCYFVPFENRKTGKTEVQFITGYRGKIDLIRRSGQVSTINAVLVYENDDIEINLGEQTIRHKFRFNNNRGRLIGVYGIAVMKDGSRHIEPMTIDEVEEIKRRSKAKDFGPWKTDYQEMVRKTVIHRMSKYLPMSVESATQLAEQEAEEFDDKKPALQLIDLGAIQEEPKEQQPQIQEEPEGDMYLELDD